MWPARQSFCLCVRSHHHRLLKAGIRIMGEDLNVTKIIETADGANADKGRHSLRRLPKLLGADRAPCRMAATARWRYAIMTQPEMRDAALVGQTGCSSRSGASKAALQTPVASALEGGCGR